MEAFTVHKEPRQKWAWEVRWNGGKTYCRSDSQNDANQIAFAMNMRRNLITLDNPLTEHEVELINKICPL